MSPTQFALTAAAAHGQVWRLWTGHLVHYDFAHLITNAIAVAGPLALVNGRVRREILLAMTVVAPAISIVLLGAARFDEYRGASGLALAIWIASALSLLGSAFSRDRKTGAALLGLSVAKLAAEMVGAGHVWEGVAPLPLAHIAGAIAGVALFACGRFFSLIKPSVPISIET